MFDFEKYNRDLVDNSYVIITLGKPIFDDLTLCFGTFYKDYIHISTKYSYDMHKHYQAVVGGETHKLRGYDLKDISELNIWADFDKQGNIIRLYNHHSDIIPCWGNYSNAHACSIYNNDNLILSVDYKTLKHKATIKMLAKKIFANNCLKYIVDPSKNKNRFVVVKTSNIEKIYIHSYEHKIQPNIQSSFLSFSLEAIEFYLLPDDVYRSYLIKD